MDDSERRTTLFCHQSFRWLLEGFDLGFPVSISFAETALNEKSRRDYPAQLDIVFWRSVIAAYSAWLLMMGVD